MKINSNNNPESSLDHSLNFPSIATLTNYEQYEQEKRQRREIQERRKILEEAVATLRREAGESTKKFNDTQDQLMYAYNKKLTLLQETRQKNQMKRLQKEELERKKNFSSLSRYLHQVKKDEALLNLRGKKKQLKDSIKSYLEEAESKRTRNQKQYLAFLNQKNKKMNQSNRENAKWAKDKSLQQKRKQSRSVRNSLITIEESLMAKQRERIEKLQKQQQLIVNLLEKNSQKCSEVESMKSQLIGMELEDFQSRVIDNMKQSKISMETKKIARSKRKKSHQRDLDLFYY